MNKTKDSMSKNGAKKLIDKCDDFLLFVDIGDKGTNFMDFTDSHSFPILKELILKYFDWLDEMNRESLRDYFERRVGKVDEDDDGGYIG